MIFPRVIHQITVEPESVESAFDFKVTDDQKGGVIISVEQRYHIGGTHRTNVALTYNEFKALAIFFYDISWDVGNCAVGDDE